MTIVRAAVFGAALLGGLWVNAVWAFDLTLPTGARLSAERITELDSLELPLAGFDGAKIPSITLEGSVTRRAWRISTAGLTPLQVMVPLREQIQQAGYDLRFECAAQNCGGFDFRFGVEVLPGPNMYVNIARFRYLSATKGVPESPSEALGVLVSVTAEAAYVQAIHADTGIDLDQLLPELEIAPTTIEEVAPTAPAAAVAVVEDKLLEDGFMILSDLEFETGTSGLSDGPYPSLDRLARLLAERSDLRLVLVGHTDAVGALEPNIALSRDRARAVRQRLIERYGVNENLIDAEGMGYLSPIASNLTAEGRDKNRRVEAVLLNIDE